MTLKHYAKKREVLGAAQWTGEMTPAVHALIGGRDPFVDAEQQLQLGNGWYARVGDWICSGSGEDLTVIGDAVFRATYEEVDAAGRPAPLTAVEHERAGQEFVQQLDDLLLAGLRLTPVDHRAIFVDRDRLTRTLRRLLEDHAFVARQQECARIRENLTKVLCP